MVRRREPRELPDDVPPLVPRINWLLREVFGDNIAWTAKVLGVSHAALSRVLAGQMPSGKMLEALAKLAAVNPWWLLTGGPQPGHGEGVGGLLCPLAETLLPGQPRAFPERLSPVTLPVASPFLVEEAYWYRVRPDDPITKDDSSRVAAGDYLLIEGSERWTRRPAAFAGRVVALRMPEGRGVVLGKVVLNEEELEVEAQHDVKFFGLSKKEGTLILGPRPASGKPARRLIEKPGLVSFYLDDLVGVCLQVSRILSRDL
jgi:transcriptional regulator with XRE-family HTH domain